MSLISDEYLLALWKEAQSKPTSEWASRSFWHQLLSKYIFDGKQFLGRRRRTAIVWRSKATSWPCRQDAGSRRTLSPRLPHLDDVEHQVLDACATYLKTYSLTHVNAMTTVGTKARVWEYIEGSDYLTQSFGSEDLSELSEYVEAHSSDAIKIKKALEDIKKSASAEASSSSGPAPPHWAFLQQKAPTLGLLHLRLVSTASGSTLVWVQVQSSTCAVEREGRTRLCDGVEEHFRFESSANSPPQRENHLFPPP